MKMRTIAAALAVLAMTGPASAQYGRENLDVGSEAPRISIDQWIQGEAVAELQAGQVYVIDFWNTNCNDCKRFIPRLNELQKSYKDSVVVIGVADGEPDAIRDFVQRMGGKMTYRVGVQPRNQMNRDWINASDRRGPPIAFIVDREKKIAWIGNPGNQQDGFEKALGQIVSGRYDPKLQARAEPMLKQVDYSRRMRDWRTCYQYLDQVIALNPHIFNSEAILKFRIMAVEQQVPADADAYARGQFMQWYAQDGETLAQLARLILNDAVVMRTDQPAMKKLALFLAECGHGASADDPKTAAVLATAHFANSNYEDAVNFAKKAYFLAPPGDKSEYKRLLDQYQQVSKSRRDGSE